MNKTNSIVNFFKKISLSSISSPTESFISNIDPAFSSEFSKSLRPIQTLFKVYPPNEKGQSFNSKWYNDYSWLEYSISKNAAFCFVCRHFGDNNSNSDSMYRKDGFKVFRKGPAKFKEHSLCQTHKTAELSYQNRLVLTESCASQLNSQHKKKVQFNRKYIEAIIETIIWLSKQGLAFRGHDESENSKNRGNFLELINFQIKYNAQLKEGSLNTSII